ncbi:MAG TPA: response regulator transcription factor [Acidimicrobiia bacterium]|jgi:two-component system nitrate/nitrite response regulator NarL
MNVARVLVVHDQRIVAETLARRLEEEEEIRVVGIATSIAAGRSAAESVGPDVAVIDVDHAQGAVAAEFVTYFTSLEPPVKVVAILDDDDSVLAAQIIRAGADAVMTDDDAVNNLIAAVLTVAQGHAWVVPRILGGVLRDFRTSRPQPNEFDRRLELLTAREREVLRRMVSGSDHATIARDLVVSVNTVRTHSQRILSKLEVHSGLEAVSVVRQSRTGGAL